MPRLSLYRPNKTNDYRFFDRTISEQFTVGGLDIYIHKYLGPKTVADDSTTTGINGDVTQPNYQESNPLFVQDLLLGEVRDRSYDPDIYVMRGVYRQQDIDFNLTQFGLFLNNDTLFITFHYNDMMDTFGRKLMAGDVLEVPNLKDYNPLNPSMLPLPKYYVIQDASRCARISQLERLESARSSQASVTALLCHTRCQLCIRGFQSDLVASLVAC